MAPSFSSLLSSWTLPSETSCDWKHYAKIALPSLASVVALYFVYNKLRSNANDNKKELRGPTPLPLVGNFLQLDPVCISETIKEMARHYGRVFRIYLPDKWISVSHPDVLQQIYSTDWMAFDKEPETSKLYEEISGGLVLTKNDLWKEYRELFNTSFAPANLNRFRTLLMEKATLMKKLVEGYANSGETFDAQQLFQRYTFDVIGLVAFGVDFCYLTQDSSPFEQAFSVALQHLMHRFMCPFQYWKWFSTPATKEYDRSVHFLFDIILQRLSYLRKEGVTDNDYTILGSIVRSEKDPNSPIKWSDRDICIHMVTFLFAGHDTTMNLMTWCFYFMSQHPDLESKLLQELNLPRLGDPNDLDRLPYLRAFINETLRLRTSAPSLGRQLREDRIIEWDENGEKISSFFPKGSKIMISIHGTHLHPDNWEDPETFNPDRFLDDAPRHPYSFIPFGNGPRRCIGEKLALQEVRTGIDAILPNYELRLAPGFAPQMQQATTLRSKNGMLMIARKRNQPNQ